MMLVTILTSLVLAGALPSSAQSDVTRIAYAAIPSVATLIMQDASGQPVSLGSGFLIGDDLVATNYHVIEGSAAGQVRFPGSKATHKIEGLTAVDATRDLAIVRVSSPSDLEPLRMSGSAAPAVGDEVVVIGILEPR